MNKSYITWEKYDKDIRKLWMQIRNSEKRYKNIFGIPRGGLIIAVHLSHLLGIPITTKLSKKTIIVDDLVDSGRTLKKYENYDTATLYRKDLTIYEPTYCIQTIDDWIVFPWEI